MKKDFDEWNTKKKDLEKREDKFFFNTGEIWWCSVGLNIDAESCGKGDGYRRPVLILKKLSRKSFIGTPLLTQKKEGSWFAEVTVHNEKRYALLYQIRMLSVKRFQRRLATLEDNDFVRVKEKPKTLFELF